MPATTPPHTIATVLPSRKFPLIDDSSAACTDTSRMPTPGKRVGLRDAMLNITVPGYRPSPSQQPGTAWPPQAAPYDGSWSELNVYIPILVLGAIASPLPWARSPSRAWPARPATTSPS